jgi:hypothetical protein
MQEERYVFWSAGYSTIGSLNWNWCDARRGSSNIPKKPFLVWQTQDDEYSLIDSCVTVDFTRYTEAFKLDKSICAKKYPFVCQVLSLYLHKNVKQNHFLLKQSTFVQKEERRLKCPGCLEDV